MAYLPSYSASTTPSPIYSAAPAPEEQVLQYTPLRVVCHSRPTGIFVRNEHKITVVIDGQEANSPFPSFGQGALLNGTVFLELHRTVKAVKIKFVGILESLSPSHGYSSLKVVDQADSLYVKNTAQTQCPVAISFARRLPSMFKHEGVHYPIPPSCDIKLPDGAFLKCTYSLTLSVIMALHRYATFLTQGRRIPRPSLFSTIKACPEEWLQLPVALTAGDSRAADLHCDLFIPSLGVFGISEVLPFHLQISGSIPSLRDLLSSMGRATSNPTIRVYLLRQITVQIGLNAMKLNTVLGEASLNPLPPAIFSPNASTSVCEDALNWEGELELQDIATPTFDVGTFKVMN
ncbi:hypothetical protein B0H19DRAFT_1064665 [Mycena capillaripes]|nr:hypothetical protein B0H19DRAFT_1064665 [Mycena capillaripes]